jgi:2-(3-amino-3-carboxypropyl)histidine synthase
VYVLGHKFRGALGYSAKMLTERNRPCNIPQAKPLSPGEVLGCTAPTILPPKISGFIDEDNAIKYRKVIVFVADGRFHLEAAMIANPSYEAFRYDPYSKLLTQEWYDTDKMKRLRYQSILKARSASTFGIVLGTLGRQGNPAIVGRIRSLLHQHEKKSVVVLLSEIFPNKLDMFPQVDAWVQVACPRLSVDWGHMFRKPLLNSHELEACLAGSATWMINDDPYPMDFYKVEGGPWTNYHEGNRNREIHL